tara:strand:+ start:125 stop:583 length:459 start_codon:yes stop_codon:yes gene_type:complete
MKKLLRIVVLGLLLSGCADPNQSSIMKDMKQDSYEKSSKVQKKVPKYMIMPERELCIYYINFYPMLTPKFLKKKAQAARKVAIEKRELDCTKFYDAAYYDKQKRKEGIAEATKKALDENAKSKKENAEILNKRRPVNCTERKSGSRIIITCN